MAPSNASSTSNKPFHTTNIHSDYPVPKISHDASSHSDYPVPKISHDASSHSNVSFDSSLADLSFDFTDHTKTQRKSVHIAELIESPKTSKPPPNKRYSDAIPLKRSRLSTAPQERSRRDSYFPPPIELIDPISDTKKSKGFFAGPTAWVVYITSLIQISVFIAEIIKNSIITGSPIMVHPQFNPMIGPSIYVQINMGARFIPCMRTIPGVQDASIPINWPCPNTTTSDPNAPSNHCDLSALCGFKGVDDANPNQWFRFIIPMFLHAGLIHIGFNMLLQLTMGREMEEAIGSIRFAIVYFGSGIFGFVLGGNYAATAIASTGASGCLFGVLALVLLDLIYCWNERKHPVRDLMWILADILVSFVLGLLPGLDNFSHIGGFLMGLTVGICILHSPNILRLRTGGANVLTYRSFSSEPDLSNPKQRSSTATAVPADVGAFAKQPVGFFKGRKPLWWGWWLLRVGALIGILVTFVVLLNNFYKYHDTCSWCKYLSCLPINHWCDLGNLQLKNTTSNNSKRHLARNGAVLVSDLWNVAGMS